MALATYLRLNNYVPEQVVWDNTTCWWEFNRNQDLEGLVLLFLNNEAQCNPREFSRTFRITRQEFHAARPSQRR
jgi:hypothetical protein